MPLSGKFTALEELYHQERLQRNREAKQYEVAKE